MYSLSLSPYMYISRKKNSPLTTVCNCLQANIVCISATPKPLSPKKRV